MREAEVLAALRGALGREDLLDDPRFTTFADRNHNRDELLSILREAFRARTTASGSVILSEAGVPHGPVYEVGDALEDEQALAREDVVEVEHPELGTVRQIASPLRLSGEPNPLGRGPYRGEHIDELLRDLCRTPTTSSPRCAR